jgi:hypothetical protein
MPAAVRRVISAGQMVRFIPLCVRCASFRNYRDSGHVKYFKLTF